MSTLPLSPWTGPLWHSSTQHQHNLSSVAILAQGHFGTNATLEAETSGGELHVCFWRPGTYEDVAFVVFSSPVGTAPSAESATMLDGKECTNDKCRYSGGGAAAWDSKWDDHWKCKDCGYSNHRDRTSAGNAPTKAAKALLGARLDALAKGTGTVASRVEVPRAASRLELRAWKEGDVTMKLLDERDWWRRLQCCKRVLCSFFRCDRDEFVCMFSAQQTSSKSASKQ